MTLASYYLGLALGRGGAFASGPLGWVEQKGVSGGAHTQITPNILEENGTVMSVFAVISPKTWRRRDYVTSCVS